jgi:hypothetical protein
MSWIDLLSSALEVSAGSVAVSGAIYAGAMALDNEMRSEAKQQIAAFIKRENRLPSADIIIRFIHDSFRSLFGPTHFSRRCLLSSCLASIAFWVFFTALFFVKYQNYVVGSFSSELDSVENVIGMILTFPLISLLPDYLSLWKGRVLLDKASSRPSVPKVVVLVIIDLAISFLISCLAWAVGAAVAYPAQGLSAQVGVYDAYTALLDGFRILLGQPPADQSDILVVTFTLTTLMTSLWAILVMLAAVGTKLLTAFSYFARMVNWMFDVDAHPVRVLGLVASIIVWAGSLMYALV